jgi:hypothetical protein
MPADQKTQSQARLRGAFSPGTQGLQLVPGEAAARGTDVGQDPGIALQVLVGYG